jgi:NAD(P)-dependent dehydrogenase (short-subunit alcohol dehydrogenase family)
MKWDFNEKVAFISGGASGIGRNIALDFASNGANVAIFDMNQELGNKTLDEIKKAGNGKAKFFAGSVSNVQDVEKAVINTFTELGEIDFLINCAGILRDFMINKFDEKKWDLTIDVNLKGVAVCTEVIATQWANISKKQAETKGLKFLPILDHKPRVIVNLASMAADGNMGQFAYSASKAGVVGLTLTAAKELYRYNVRSHVVKPTLIDTPIIGDLLQKDEGKFKKMYEDKIPFGIGKTEYVSNVVCFLCSEGGYFMNGCIIPINGGKLDGL